MRFTVYQHGITYTIDNMNIDLNMICTGTLFTLNTSYTNKYCLSYNISNSFIPSSFIHIINDIYKYYNKVYKMITDYNEYWKYYRYLSNPDDDYSMSIVIYENNYEYTDRIDIDKYGADLRDVDDCGEPIVSETVYEFNICTRKLFGNSCPLINCFRKYLIK